MHKVSKRVRFRALVQEGMSKTAISRELGIGRRTATRWAAADRVGRNGEALKARRPARYAHYLYYCTQNRTALLIAQGPTVPAPEARPSVPSVPTNSERIHA